MAARKRTVYETYTDGNTVRKVRRAPQERERRQEEEQRRRQLQSEIRRSQW